MCRLLFLSWHTWGRGGACPDSSVSSSCSVPDPGSLQLFYSKGLERALPLLTLNFTLPTSQPGSDLSQWSMDWNTERLGISSKKLVREIRGTWALGQEEGPFAPGPLPRPGELRLWECKACARLGHTGSFVLPPPQRRHYSTLCPQILQKTQWTNSGEKLQFILPKRHVERHCNVICRPHPSIEGSGSPPRVRSKKQRMGRSDVSGASMLPAL